MAGVDHSLNRMRSLLSSYYGIGDDDGEKESSALDIDSSAFDMPQYMANLLRTKPAASLLEEDNQLVQEIKTLDSDMQMLVYENYNKFIGATDTIRNMKDQVGTMETQAKRLSSNIDALARHSEDIDGRLARRRSRIEQLVGVRRLLKKLEFLFELPMCLNRSMELGAYSQAVSYYQQASTVLMRYAEVPSFVAIHKEARAIMERLKQELRQRVRSGATSSAKLTELVGLLLQLDEPAQELRAIFLQWHEARLRSTLQRVAQQAAPAAAEGAGDAQRSPLENFIVTLKTHFVDAFVDVICVYDDLFLRGSPLALTAPAAAAATHTPAARGATAVGGRADEEARAAAMQFARVVFAEFFAVVRARLLQENVLQENALKSPPAAEGAGTSAADAAAAADGRGGARDQPFAPFVRALRTLMSSVRAAHTVARDARLLDRATETAERVVLYQLEMAFADMRGGVLVRLQQLLRKCEERQRREQAQAQRLAGDATEEPEAGEGDAGEAAAGDGGEALDAAESAADRPFDDVREVADWMLQALETSLLGLKPLLEAGQRLLDESDRQFSELVLRQVAQFTGWLTQALRLAAGPAPDELHAAWCARAETVLRRRPPSAARPAAAATARSDRAAGDGDDGTAPAAAATSTAAACAAEGAAEDADSASLVAQLSTRRPPPQFALMLACLARETAESFVTALPGSMASLLPRSEAEAALSTLALTETLQSSLGAQASAAALEEVAGQLLQMFVWAVGMRLSWAVASAHAHVHAQLRSHDGALAAEGMTVSAVPLRLVALAKALATGVSAIVMGSAADAAPSAAAVPALSMQGVPGGLGGHAARPSFTAAGGGAATGAAASAGAGSALEAMVERRLYAVRSPRARRGVQLDIERLFTQRASAAGAVDFRVGSMVTAAVRMALKSLVECVRECTLTLPQFQQWQVDCHFLRSVAPRLAGGASGDTDSLDALVEELMTSAVERALEPAPLDPTDVVAITRPAVARTGPSRAPAPSTAPPPQPPQPPQQQLAPPAAGQRGRRPSERATWDGQL